MLVRLSDINTQAHTGSFFIECYRKVRKLSIWLKSIGDTSLSTRTWKIFVFSLWVLLIEISRAILLVFYIFESRDHEIESDHFHCDTCTRKINWKEKNMGNSRNLKRTKKRGGNLAKNVIGTDSWMLRSDWLIIWIF